MDWFDDVPKIELHLHLEGAIPHDGLFDLIQKYGGDPSVPDTLSLARRFEYRSFAEFIGAWSWKNRFLCEYEDFSHIAEAVANDLVRQNMRYVELMFSPSLFVRQGLEVQKVTQAVRTGLSRVKGVRVALVADLVRDYGPEAEMKTLEQLREVMNLGVVGIGIGGSEHEFPPAPFSGLFEAARRMGFHTNAHAGEAAGAGSIWDAILELRVERIGHGVRAEEDPELVRYLSGHKIPLEMCPVSNVRTRVVESMEKHPVRRYFDAGMVLTINTDDPKMFQTSLAEEYRQLERECGFTRQEIRTLILSAITSSWLSQEERHSLAEEVQSDPAWVK